MIQTSGEDAEAIKADNARWDALFAATPEDTFDDLIKESLEEDTAGLTDEWNPETDPERS
ncbi:MAG: hypothetical protein U0528_08675 [Anaerolineae bacterium]